MKKFIVYILISCTCFSAYAQYKNNIWRSGYEGFDFPWGRNKIVFEGSNRTITDGDFDMRFYSCYANINSENNDWMLYSNGIAICNKYNDTLVNGGGLTPEGIWSGSIDGLPIPHQANFIPSDSANKIYFIHQNDNYYITTPPQPCSPKVFYSLINPLSNNMQGEVYSKNNVLINDTTEIGRVMSVRHANGRDWWVFIKRMYSNFYYRVLLTPDSILPVDTFSVNEPLTFIGGQVCISPNGKYYCSFSNNPTDQLRLYDVDRCSGRLFNFRQKYITTNVAGYVSFSPNSRFLYISSTDTLWQFDMEAEDIFASQTFIASYDGFIDTNFNQATGFSRHWLGADGKIYVNTPNTMYLHVINNPDLPGVACDFQQHAIQLPAIYNRTTPTPINYNLKQLSGSPCDTLGVGIRKLKVSNEQLKVFPNPSNGRFSIEYPAQEISGMLFVYDAQGKELYREYVSPYSIIKNIDLSKTLSAGMYGVSLVFGNERLTRTLVISE